MAFIKEIDPSNNESHSDNVGKNKKRPGIADFTRHIYSRAGRETNSVLASPRDTDSAPSSPQDHKGKGQLSAEQVALQEKQLKSMPVGENGKPMEKQIVLSEHYDENNPGLAGGVDFEDIFTHLCDVVSKYSPELISRLIAMALKTVLDHNHQDKKFDELHQKLDDQISSHYNTAIKYLQNVESLMYNNSDLGIKTKLDELEKASDCFIVASSHTSDAFMQAKAMVFAGVCYELRGIRECARLHYGLAYNTGKELWQQKTAEIEKIRHSLFIKKENRTKIEQQLLDFDQFMEHLRDLVNTYPSISTSGRAEPLLLPQVSRMEITSSSTSDRVTIETLQCDKRELQNKVSTLESSNRTLQGDKRELQNKVSTLESSNRTLQGDKRELQNKVSTLESEKQRLKSQLDSINQEKRDQERIIQDLKRQLAEIQRQDTSDRSLLRNPERLTEIQTLNRGGSVVWCNTIHNGRLYTGHSNGEIKIWNLNNGESIQTLNRGGSVVWRNTIHNGRLYTGHDNGEIKIWNLNNGESIQTLNSGGSGVWCNTIHNGRLYTGHDNGEIKIWNLNNGESIQTLKSVGSWVNCNTIHNGRLYTGHGNGEIKIWNLNNGESIQTLNSVGSGVWCNTIHNGRLYTGHGNGEIKIWNLNNGESIQTLKSVGSWVNCNTIHNGRLYTGHGNGEIKIWNLNNGESIQTLNSVGSGVWCNTIHNGRLYTGHGNGEIKIWGEE